MTKFLVVDTCFIGYKSYIQTMTLTLNGDLNELSEYKKVDIEGLHAYECAEYIRELFINGKFDYIFMDIMGSSMTIYEHMKEIERYVVGCEFNTQNNHDCMCRLMSDIRNGRLFIDKYSLDLYECLLELNRSIYTSPDNGLMKIHNETNDYIRDMIHMFRLCYRGINKINKH